MRCLSKFDNVRQECWMRINKPEIAKKMYEDNGHAKDWPNLLKDDVGRFDHVTPGKWKNKSKRKKAILLCSQLSKVAEKLVAQDKKISAEKVEELVQFIIRG